jgi:hypothetical protein
MLNLAHHWFTRDAWWDTRRDAAVGSGDLVSIEFWQVQVRLGSNSALLTFTLRRNPLSTSGCWKASATRAQ